MKHTLRLSAFLAVIAAFASVAVAEEPVKMKKAIEVGKMKNEVVTTIASVKVDADGKGATIYANNDVRLLRLSGTLGAKIAEAINAKKNGWEVKLTLKGETESKTFEIANFEIKARVNTLTTGFNKPDRTFAPIVAKSVREIQDLFKSVYSYDADSYDVSDNCYNRAQYWSRTHQMNEAKFDKYPGTGTDKIFIFFTDAYIAKYKHKWWYHVAPVVYLKKEGSDTKQAWALDPTFLPRAVTIEDWLGAFDHYTEGRCEQVQTLDEFHANSHKPICMYIVASMFHYNPSDLNEEKMTNWRCADFKRMMESIPAPGKNTTDPSASWRDRKFSEVMPEMCRR